MRFFHHSAKFSVIIIQHETPSLRMNKRVPVPHSGARPAPVKDSMWRNYQRWMAGPEEGCVRARNRGNVPTLNPIAKDILAISEGLKTDPYELTEAHGKSLIFC